MKMKNVLAGAAIATLAAVGSFAPSQTVVAEARAGYALATIGSHYGWWGNAYNDLATNVITSTASAGYALWGQYVGAMLGASAAASGAKYGAAAGAAGGPVGLLIGAALGAA